MSSLYFIFGFLSEHDIDVVLRLIKVHVLHVVKVLVAVQVPQQVITAKKYIFCTLNIAASGKVFISSFFYTFFLFPFVP